MAQTSRPFLLAQTSRPFLLAQARPSAVKRLGLQRYAILIVFGAMIVSFGIAIPSTFLSIGNLSNILGGQAVLFILVMAVILPTIMGDFVDLSLGSSLGLSAMPLAVLNVQHGTNVVLACLAGATCWLRDLREARLRQTVAAPCAVPAPP